MIHIVHHSKYILMASAEFGVRNRLSMYWEDVAGPKVSETIENKRPRPLDEENIANRRARKLIKKAEKHPGKKIGLAFGDNISGLAAYPRAIKQAADAMIAGSDLGIPVRPTFIDSSAALQTVARLKGGKNHTARVDTLVLDKAAEVIEVVLFNGWQNSDRARRVVETASLKNIPVIDRSNNTEAA